MAARDLTGEAEVLRNLNKEIRKIKGRTVRGLFNAGLLVQRRSQQKTPVDTGNLKGGAYTGIIRRDPHEVEIGYQAFYAVYVHERLELAHTVGEAKFLEKALTESERDVLDQIAKEAEIK